MKNNGSGYSQLLEHVVTVEDRVRFLEQLDILLSSLFNTKIDVSLKIKELFGYSTALSLLKSIEKLAINPDNAQALQKYIADLKSDISLSPTISITLPFELSEAQIMKISQWFKTELGESVFLDISVDRRLVAGIIIEYKGVYRDYSLRKRLEDYIGLHKSLIR